VCRYSYTRYHVAPPERRSMYASAGLCPYVPFVLRVRSEHLDNADDRVLWYAIFADKFHMHNSQRAGGYNAVYMQVFNYSKTFRNSQSTLRVLAVLPPGADLPSASRSWQVKLRVASESGFKAWSFVDNREMQYYLLPCLLIADHMQQVETLCHLGNKAKRNGRSTWTKDTERCNVTTDPRDHAVMRRWAQTEVVKAQQCRRAQLLGFVVGSENDRALRTVSGIDHRAHSETTGGPICDPHLACTWDPCHLLEHGYLRFIVRVVLKSLPKKLRIVFRSVLRDFRWPKGVSRPVMGWTKGDVFPKSQISWDFTKKVVMVSMVRLCGLWPEGGGDVKDLYMFLCRFGRWVFQMMGPVPVHRHTELQREVDKLVVLGERLIGDEYENKTALLGKWDRPNLLGLRELAYIVLPMLGNVTFANAAKFEAHHKITRAATVKSGGAGHLAAMKLVGDRCAIAYACRGGRWGENREMGLGSEFLTMKDPRVGKRQNPHPVIVEAAECWHSDVRVAAQGGVHIPTTGADAFVGLDWEPVGSSTPGTLSDGEWNSIEAVYEMYYQTKWCDTWKPSLDTRIEDVDAVAACNHAQELRVCLGDDVASSYQEDAEAVVETVYSNVRRLTFLTLGGRRTAWLWPRWYKLSQVDRVESEIERDARLAYNHLGAPIVYLDHRQHHDPFPVRDLKSQVMVVHACVRRKFTLSGMPISANFPPGTCGLQLMCNEHQMWGCEDCEDNQNTLRDRHDERNNSFVVLTTALGFHPFYRKAMSR
jgi:hypothetical protein